MKPSHIYSVLLTIPVVTLIAVSCTKDRDNLLDPQNSQTHGDPFHLSAQFTNRGVSLQWGPVDNPSIAYYTIYRGGDATSTPKAIDTIDNKQIYYLDSAVSSDAVYYYRISARDRNNNESALSQGASVTVPSLKKWLPVGTGMGYAGARAFVWELCEFDNRLIIGGAFPGMDSVQSTNLIAWNGDAFQPLTNLNLTINDQISALAVFENKLLVTGYLASLPGKLVTWQAGTVAPFPDTGLSGSVNDIYIYKDMLVAAGRFQLGSATYDSLACKIWNGNVWDSPQDYFLYADEADDGAWGTGLALCSYGDQLVIAGNYSNNIFTPHGVLAYTRYSVYADRLGGGTNGSVLTMVVYNGLLIVGGNFTSAGSSAANNIAAWNGVSWSPLGLGVNGRVSTLTVYNGKLIVGGDFSQAGGIPAYNIACWDGTGWSTLGSGFDYEVRALTVYNDCLIAGGDFTKTGGVAVDALASWLELSP